MLLIPAIDIKGGKCVRLRQGIKEKETIFSDNPLTVAQRWISQKAERLHIIDLDGAFDGKPHNMKVVEQIATAFPDVTIQVGGGIRNEDTVQEYLNCGVEYVIIGTRAASQPHIIKDLCLEFPGHIIVGLDIKDGKVATNGWSKVSHHDPIDLAQHFENDGVVAIVHTDTSRDGMMQGPNIESSVKLAASTHIPIIAAGGFTALADIEHACSADEEGMQGIILGRSLYEGKIDLTEAYRLVEHFATDKSRKGGSD
ncbi:MAG: 1-(5-phosphoribosyl)-5-[(5-phosphoribosylamino)methylideneamino]imidazole-4-carboxamide isomerase [Chromatiales bacterium]|nr:1-(5-phosphoribosyl)-5-[(5-phosphoribosylamino)methylideneamino]imidazole-4-carboxamide isomerase [Chromatiales bacterium]